MKILEQEIWRPVRGYEGFYSVSTSGKIKRTKASRGVTIGKEKIFYKNRNGYFEVGLWKNTKRRTWSVHRLVAITFLGNPPKGLQVNHKDGIKVNNYVSNLEYVTQSENAIHAYKIGLRKPMSGEKCWKAKLKGNDVLKIRELFSANIYDKPELSEIYKISRRTIRDIINRETWTHI